MPIHKTFDYFINKANKIHNNKFDYSKITEFRGVMEKYEVICPEHGSWFVSLDNHINKKSSCPKCKGRNRTKEDWIKECKKIHGEKYDYSLFPEKMKNTSEKISIICREHGLFLKELNNHIYQNQQGCPNCAKYGRKSLTFEQIQQKILDLKNKDYEYNWESYKGYYEKLEIKCPKHGWFEQQINNHLFGQKCPKCLRSIGEEKIAKFLNNLGIIYEVQKTFEGCINPKTNYKLKFDFYIPSTNTCVEYDGELHTQSVKFFGGNESLKECQFKDKIKTKYCKNNNIELLRISYLEFKNIDQILENKL